jgi:hypothetical protein
MDQAVQPLLDRRYQLTAEEQTRPLISPHDGSVPTPDSYSKIFQYESLRITLPLRNV